MTSIRVGPSPRAGAIDGLAGGVEDRLGVVVLDPHAGHAVAAARSAFEAIAVECELGTEIAHSLSSQTKTTGSFHNAARFSDS